MRILLPSWLPLCPPEFFDFAFQLIDALLQLGEAV